jgi:hypothetical protein
MYVAQQTGGLSTTKILQLAAAIKHLLLAAAINPLLLAAAIKHLLLQQQLSTFCCSSN